MPYRDALIAAAQGYAGHGMFWLIAGSTVFLIAFAKGALGGGVASIGVPMLSLIIDPLGAAIIIAPLVSAMDMVTLQSFGPKSWSKPDLKVLLPGLLIGLGMGWLMFETIDPRYVGLVIGLISIGFALYWFWHRRLAQAREPMPVHGPLGLVAGAASGFTTFVAHAGGPPVAMYLIKRGLDKRLFVGTSTAFFTLGNLLKLGPYGVLLAGRPDAAGAALILAPLIPLAVMLGVRMHDRLSREHILLATNIVLILGGGRLLYQSLVSLMG